VRPARRNTTRFLLGFITVLALLPALVWGIQAAKQDLSAPAVPRERAADAGPRAELGCAALIAPESLAARAAACETEPPAWSPPEPQRRPRPEPRPAAPTRAATAKADRPTDNGEAETKADEPAPVVPADDPRDAVDIVGAFLAPAPELPVEPLDEVEDALDEAQALLPERVDARPEVEVHLEPAPIVPIPAPDAVPAPDPVVAVEPPVEPPPTALLVLDERTAEELGIPSRLTIALGENAQRALAILSERMGLELSIAAPSS
jgi:hypothetical protein